MELIRKHSWIKLALVYGAVVCCTAVLVSLCFNEGIDYDEAFSMLILHNSANVGGVVDALLATPYTDVIPLWYMALKLWTLIFGDSFVACKMFTVLGSVCTMLLGATVVRRNWGCKTALLFLIPAGLAPGMMQVGVNIRTYSWTVFLVTACALAAYSIVQNSGKWYIWLILFLTTIAGLFCHHFTAFGYLFIYLYLFVELVRRDRKSIWKMFVCGIGAVLPFGLWLLKSDFFRLKTGDGGQLSFEKVSHYDLVDFLFGTPIEESKILGQMVFVLAVVLFFLLRKRFKKEEKGFVLLSLFAFIFSYVLSAILASTSSHFIAPRHTMHTLALLWLGIAIILPKINMGVYISGILYVVALCSANYTSCYDLEYGTLPYMEETKVFIAENMQQGDVVIYNAEEKFRILYDCYMPEVEYLYFAKMTDEDIENLAGKRVWFMLCTPDFFTEEQQAQYGISYENTGHYGFQIIGDCTDFDMLWMEIEGTGL